MRSGQRDTCLTSTLFVARRLHVDTSAVLSLVEGGARASEAQPLTLDPVTLPHPRSPYAVWRRLAPSIRHATEGSCCQRIPHVSRGLSARLHCLCFGVLPAPSLRSHEDLVDCFSAAVLRQLTREGDRNRRTAPDVLREQFPCSSPRFHDGVLVALCDRIPVRNASTESVVLTLLSAEEAESIREDLIRLEEHPRFGAREMLAMKNLSSFRMLWVLHSTRGFAPHGPRSAASQQHLTNDREAHDAMGDVPWLTAADVPAEAYGAVCQNYISFLRGGGSESSPVPPVSEKAATEVSSVELCFAYALRMSNPPAYHNFLVEVLQREHSCIRSPASDSSEPQLRFCTLLLYDLVSLAAKEAIHARVDDIPANLDSLIPWICVIGTELRAAAQQPRSSHVTLHGVFSELLAALDHRLPDEHDGRVPEPPPRIDTALLRQVALHLLRWCSTEPIAKAALNSHVVILQRLRHKVVRLLNVQAPSDVIPLCREAYLLDPWHVETFVEQTVSLFVDAGVPGLLRDGLTDLLETAERDLGGGSDDLAGVYHCMEQLAQHVHPSPPTSDGISVILTNLATLGTLICAGKPSTTAILTSTDPRQQRQRASGEQPHLIRSEVAFLGGPIEFLRFLYNAFDRFRAHPSTSRHVAVADAAPYTTEEQRSGAATSCNLVTQRDKSLPVIQASSTPALQARFVILLEKVVAAVAARQPVYNAPLAHFVEHHLALPSPQDEYRRVMFLLANVASSPKTAHSAPNAELQTVCASLPQLFLPWSAIKITRQVLTQSRGNSPQFLHLMHTAVDLQLPPSATRSRVAGILEVFKLLDSQRSKLSEAEYRRLWWRCAASWPLSVFLSSWTFFCTWCAIGIVALLHYSGWSWEAAYVVRHCRRQFCMECAIDNDSSRDPEEGGMARRMCASPRGGRVDAVYLDDGCPLGGGTIPLHGCVSCLELKRGIVRAITSSRTCAFPFLLAPRIHEGTGALLYDDIVHDAAQRIRFAFNSTTNPLSRALFNLLPITSLRSEEALIAAVARESLRQGTSVDFILPVPCAADMTLSTYKRLAALFGGGGGKTLHLIAARRSLPLTTDGRIAQSSAATSVDAAGGPVVVVLRNTPPDLPSPPPARVSPCTHWATRLLQQQRWCTAAAEAPIRLLLQRLSRAATLASRELWKHEPQTHAPSWWRPLPINETARRGMWSQLQRFLHNSSSFSSHPKAE